MSDYEKLIDDVLLHTQGHPLAIEVLGSSLFGCNVSQWRSALNRLKENKSKHIMDVLQISFDELEDIEKEIFLDIACFFNGCGEEYVKEILDFRGFHSEYGLRVLVDKSLITIVGRLIKMHSLLEDLGRGIVREKSLKEPRNWSRLWDYQDLHKVMSNNMTAENLEVIIVRHHSEKCQGTTLHVDTLSKLSHLKLLKLELQEVKFSGKLNDLSNELGYVTWIEFPFKCLPPSFQPNKLVELVLCCSNIKQLWEGTKSLPNLRILDLSYSKNLIEMPNLGEALNLERLNLQKCVQLRKIDPSIGLLRKLTELNLKDCKSIIKLPHFGEALNLKRLNMEGCIQLRQIDPSICLLRKLTELNLKDCKSIIKLPHFGEALNLKRLNMEGCIQLRQIDPSICLLRKLTKLNLKDCKSIIKLPHFGEALNLKRLNMEGCIQLRQIDPSIGLLKKLTILNLKNCKNLVSLPSNILNLNSLEYLSLSGCSKLYIIPPLDEPRDAENLKKLCVDEAPIHSQSTSSIVKRRSTWLFHLLHSTSQKDSVSYLLPSLPTYPWPWMRELDLNFCNLRSIPDAIEKLHSLEILNLSGNNFTTLPSLKELSKLYHLNLSHCKKLNYMPELPSRTDFFSPDYVPWYPFQYTFDERALGLSIFNCPELVETECCTSKSFSWMKQLVQSLDQNEIFIPYCEKCDLIVPGSDIPSWFSNQDVGSSISIDASPLMQHDNEWIGLACCAIFVVRHEWGTDLVPRKTKEAFPIFFPVFLNKDLVAFESDHTWVFYFTRPQLNGSYVLPNINYVGDPKLDFEIINQRGFHFEVKKYGHRWVYEHDLELSNNNDA